ncbi:MAG: hypothetical protein IKS45_06545, partial [Thermoguttaceae bacterium]|nr:hypothetical protein [Thermoguttaceae bacterium]
GEFEGKNLFFKKVFHLLIKLEKTSTIGSQLAGDRKFFQVWRTYVRDPERLLATNEGKRRGGEASADEDVREPAGRKGFPRSQDFWRLPPQSAHPRSVIPHYEFRITNYLGGLFFSPQMDTIN